MDITNLIIFLVVGAIAGWLAGVIMKGRGFGILGNMVVGIIGGFVGGFLFRFLKISLGTGIISYILTAAIGAVALLFVIGLIKK
ncbi:MAG: GlsB/YeaQ/YmgE family stress response membrane protein [bacterium]|nr:GlsB/YeaQ/YmgE family stress response membrane protein [bacterium]